MNTLTTSVLDAAVIGAGHSGLSISYYLRQQSINHMVFERGKIGETWRSQRWDSFAMNTANKLNLLPGQPNPGNEPDVFGTAGEFVTALEDYVSYYHLPVQENSSVIAVNKPDGKDHFILTVFNNGSLERYHTKQVIVASGNQNVKLIPAFAGHISQDILQLHTGQYRNPGQLPEGAVLVVGSGQSGCQIAEDLADAGRTVYLSTSRVARLPRRYRGKDIIDWLTMVDFFELQTEMVTDPMVLNMKVPLLSGIGPMGHTISLQYLASKGVHILGKAENAGDCHIFLSPNAREHVKFGDGFSQNVKTMLDDFINKNKIEAPEPELDMGDLPDDDASCASAISSLDLKDHNINTIIWTTGFTGNFRYLEIPAKDRHSNPVHKNGHSEVSGLYFIGLPWLRKRKSAIIFGINEDALFLAGAMK